MAHQNLYEIPQPIGLYAAELYKRGSDFRAAAECVFSQREDLVFPVNYLLSHALELFLKSYLASCGVEKKFIFDLQHKLIVIFGKCVELAMPNVSKLSVLVEHIAIMNNKQDFRYPTGFDILMPSPSGILVIIKELETAIGPQIEAAQIRSNLKFAADTKHLRGKRVRWSD